METLNNNLNLRNLNYKASRRFYYIALFSYTICLLYFLPDNVKYGRNGILIIDLSTSVTILLAFGLYLRKTISLRSAILVYVYSALLNICFSSWYYFREVPDYSDLILVCTSIYCINLAVGGLCLGYKHAFLGATLYIVGVGPVLFLSGDSFLNRYGLMICILMLTFAAGIAWFLVLLDKSYKREQLLKEELLVKDKALAEEKEKLLKYELDNKQRELVAKSLFLNEHAENNVSLIHDLKVVRQKLGIDDKKMIDTVISKHRIDQQDEYWKDFETTFLKVHPEFYKRLNDLCPKLSPAELKLAALIRLGLSSKQIACICSNTTESVEVARSRLRNKINLPDNTSLKAFLMGMDLL